MSDVPVLECVQVEAYADLEMVTFLQRIGVALQLDYTLGLPENALPTLSAILTGSRGSGRLGYGEGRRRRK